MQHICLVVPTRSKRTVRRGCVRDIPRRLGGLVHTYRGVALSQSLEHLLISAFEINSFFCLPNVCNRVRCECASTGGARNSQTKHLPTFRLVLGVP